ncbi:MAG: helix-turn-helix domain-containing protein [Myxococcota bacterium]
MARGSKGSSRADKNISLRVKELMEGRQWDQKDLASYLDLSEGYVSRILSGERPWPVATLFKAAQALEVPVSQLDPQIEAVLREELLELEVPENGPHMQAVQAVIEHLSKIQDPAALDAISRVLEAFAQRR